MPRERDLEFEAAEQRAMDKLRREYGMVACGAGKYDAYCPAHDDLHSKSLRVYRSKDGRLRFRCYANCHFNDIRAKLGLSAWQSGTRTERVAPTRVEREARKVRYDFPALARYFAGANHTTLGMLARELKVSKESLIDAGVGFADRYPMHSNKREAELRRGGYVPTPKECEVLVTAWTFPMLGSMLNVTGIRMRSVNAKVKYSFTDSVPGIFAGTRWVNEGPVLIFEGATDRLAGYDWGFDAWAKPSCDSGDDILEALLREMVAVGMRRDLVIFSQVDEAKERVKGRPEAGVFYPGQDGALRTADRLARLGKSCRIITAAPGYKDARSWYNDGATRRDVDRMIASKRPHVPARRRSA